MPKEMVNPMGDDSWPFFLLLILLILGGGYFAGAEIAFASANKIRQKTQAEAGDRRAKNAMFIHAHFDSALTTLLIGNNIMHIGGSALATMLTSRIWGPKAAVWTTIIMTVLVFFISEMLPKSYARSHADAASLAVAPSLRFLMRIFAPLAWFFNKISMLIARLFGGDKKPSFTEAELEYMLETAQDSPSIQEKDEGRLLSAAVAFDHITARQAMRPRETIEALELGTPAAQAARFIQTHTHSRIPVYRGDVDHIIGVIHIRTFLRDYLRQGGKTRLRTMLNPAAFVRPEAPIDEVLRQMSNHRVQLGIVQDENGKTLGVLTVEDILEKLVGDILDEEDTEGTVAQHG
ncbi:MAG: HlyC/CorC family transporter [Clostridia bacterium]|nr:HlyC/CorC family transporter [Clostridia bacterium]